MELLFKKIAITILSAVVFLGSAVGLIEGPQEDIAGATIPKVVAKFETSLSSGITSSDTSMTLVKGTDAAGNALSGYTCFVIDEGTSSEEFVCGTASSTSITSLLRGIDPVDGDLEVSGLKMSHRRGASVKITDHPSLSIALRVLNGDETIPNVIKYNAPKTFTASSSLVDKNYVDNIAIAGGVVATESVPGISILSTQSQISLGTATTTYSGTDYSLIPQNRYFNATSTATTTVPVTKTGGKLSQGFLDLTESFSFSGGLTSSATTTLTSTTTISGNTTLSATTTISGNATFNGSTTFNNIPTLPSSNPTSDNQAVRKAYVDTSVGQVFSTGAITGSMNSQISTETVMATSTIPGGTLGANDAITIRASFKNNDGDPNAWVVKVRWGGISGTQLCSLSIAGSGNDTGFCDIFMRNNNSTSSQVFLGSTNNEGNSSSLFGTASINTANDVNIVFTGSTATAGSQGTTNTLQAAFIEIIKSR